MYFETHCIFPSLSSTFLCTAGRILLEYSLVLLLWLSWGFPLFQNKSPWGFLCVWRKDKSPTEQDHLKREVVWVRWCSSLPWSAGCSAQLVVIFSDILKSLVIIFHTCPFFYVQQTCDLSNRQLDWSLTVNRGLPHTTCLSHLTLTSVLFTEGLLLLDLSFTSSWPSFDPCAT